MLCIVVYQLCTTLLLYCADIIRVWLHRNLRNEYPFGWKIRISLVKSMVGCGFIYPFFVF